LHFVIIQPIRHIKKQIDSAPSVFTQIIVS